MKSTIIWDITPCRPLSVNRCFGEIYRLRLQGRKISWARNQRESRLQALPHIASIFSFNPEYGGDMFLRNVGWHWTDYTALYPRRWYSSFQRLSYTDLSVTVLASKSFAQTPGRCYLPLPWKSTERSGRVVRTLLCIREVSSSNLSPKNNIPDCDFRWFFSVSSGKYQKSASNEATAASFHIPS
jgi:hypothetical protein